MKPWQEDNVIFFKLAHINERAGYLGKTMWGEGPYRFIITPYYFLYKIFGYTIPVYYALAFTAFFLASVSIYFLFKTFINKRAGVLASLLFGAGYVAYDGFVRIYNSTSASLGIIFFSILFLSYWKYFRIQKKTYYLSALISYYLAIQFSYIRVHYLIIPIILFEIIFLNTKLKISNLFKSVIRIIPFVFIFFKLYLGGDSREGSILELVKSILSGKLGNTFSFFSTIGYLFIPDKLQSLLPLKQMIFFEVLILVIVVFIVYKITRNLEKRTLITSLVGLLGLIWLFASQKIFSQPTLIYSNPQTILASFLGGIFIVLIPVIAIIMQGNHRKLFIFFSLMSLANIAAYAAYTPTTPYTTGYRYLAHSFVAFIGILLTTTDFMVQKLHSKKPIYALACIILLLLVLGVTNLRNIVENKSERISLFYTQLKQEVPSFPKGSLIYFDIQDNPIAKSIYAVSFSVAEMPDTTAIAWRYGIDRYDIKMFTDYETLKKEIKDTNTPLDKVYTFWISENGLTNTTDTFRNLGSKTSNPTTQNINVKGGLKSGEDVVINLANPINSVAPNTLTFKIKASSLASNQQKFPLNIGITTNPIFDDPTSMNLAFDYQNFKTSSQANSTYEVSSEWKERILQNIHDNNPDTVWQADRVTWDKEETFAKIDLKRMDNLSGLAWINGYSNNTPTKYKVSVSLDNKEWKEVAQVDNPNKINATDIQIVKFSPVDARFIKITLLSTLGGDSPAIAELWPLSSKYKTLDLTQAESFLKNPFEKIITKDVYLNNLLNVKYIGKAKVSWLGNESEKWLSTNNSVIDIRYDEQQHDYVIDIPPTGTEISTIKISGFTIPGEVNIHSIGIVNKRDFVD